MKSKSGDNPSFADVPTAMTFSVVAGMALHRGPISGIDASPDGGRLLLSNYGDDSVSVIRTGSWAEVNAVAGINEPFAIAISGADPGHAYVNAVSPAYDGIAVIDLESNSVVASHPVDLTVTDLAVSPDGRHVYVSRVAATGADVAVLETATGRVEPIDIAASAGSSTECVRVTPDGRRLYVAVQRPSGGEVVAIDTHLRRVIDTVDIGWAIRDVAISPDGRTAYVVSNGADFGVVVDVIDTHTNKVTVTRKLSETGGLVTQLKLSGDGDRAYLVGDDRVAVMCTSTYDVIGAVTVGGQPSCVAESPDGKYLYVADYSGAVTVISIASPTASLTETEGEHTAPLEQRTREFPQLEPALT
ncbi:beta-propeller fold lactonase family protein [Mycobacterium noviomagense]|uniref:YncE family protein n=1 Tax=Mycobacterium noviomagense TaxID=459858 RepID=UPI00111C8107|nr:YncE family protein [Mycobacterium noviomagense]